MDDLLALLITEDYGLTLFGLILLLAEILALSSVIHAVMKARSAPAAIAWSMALVLQPFLTLPLYWIFGRRRFQGYVNARRAGNQALQDIAQALNKELIPFIIEPSQPSGEINAVEALAAMPVTNGNAITLLKDGEATFQAMFDAIDHAEEYILIQFYIIRDDELGQRFKNSLIQRAQSGVQILFLFDEIGCSGLPGRYLEDLTRAGVIVSGFKTTRGPANRFQLNFRNHRKIVIVDGRQAFVGGHNIGDEYLGLDPDHASWRDSHVLLSGPVVQCVQLSFIEDWNWAQSTVPDLNWTPKKAKGENRELLVLSTGPADSLETCSLLFVHAINVAKDRIWISSPYFVPSEEVMAALQLAALRGVDVRILIPARADNILVWLAGHTYYPPLSDNTDATIRIFKYNKGFLHQKAMVIDDTAAAIGSANLDNRSFRLNFEIIILAIDEDFTAEVTEMFENDFSDSTEIEPGTFDNEPFWFRFLARLARLFSPIL